MMTGWPHHCLPILLLCLCQGPVFSDEILSTSYNFSRQLVSGAASLSDSDYYFLDEDQDSGLDPVFLASMSSNNVSVSAGTRAHLHCTIENAHRKTVSWMRLDNKTTEPSLLAVGQFVFTKDKRVAVTVQPAISRYSLTIVNSLVSDSGHYECQVNTEPHIGHTMHLSVREPKCSIVGEKSVYLNVGSSHTINCTVASPQPPDHIFWYFNHRPLPVTSHDHQAGDWAVTSLMAPDTSWSQVVLASVQVEHSGLYECRPSNCDSDTVSLVILDGELRAAMQANSADATNGIEFFEVCISTLLWFYFYCYKNQL